MEAIKLSMFKKVKMQELKDKMERLKQREEAAKKVFNECEKDKDGNVELDELRSLLQKMGLFEGVSKEEENTMLEEMFAQADVDNNKQVRPAQLTLTSQCKQKARGGTTTALAAPTLA